MSPGSPTSVDGIPQPHENKPHITPAEQPTIPAKGDSIAPQTPPQPYTSDLAAKEKDSISSPPKPTIGSELEAPQPTLKHPEKWLPIDGDRKYVPPKQKGAPGVVRRPEGDPVD